MKIEMEPYKPTKPESFWCSQCDQGPVDSENPETGSFFVQFGHGYSQRHRGYEGEYLGVMFCVCRRCLDQAAK